MSLRTVPFFLATALALGCSTERSFRSVPDELVAEASALPPHRVRTWADGVDGEFIDSIAAGVRRSEEVIRALPESDRPRSIDLLAISGGADDGAYGAGLLCGWSERGDRPEFRLVTGISTGALIAPLAFLGSGYDEVLRDAYTTIGIDDVVSFRYLLDAIYNDGMADTDPLGELIQRWITTETLAAIAKEHRDGRRLFIQTVNMEAQRGVIWDMGAIAASGHPRAEALFRQIMLASALGPGGVRASVHLGRSWR